MTTDREKGLRVVDALSQLLHENWLAPDTPKALIDEAHAALRAFRTYPERTVMYAVDISLKHDTPGIAAAVFFWRQVPGRPASEFTAHYKMFLIREDHRDRLHRLMKVLHTYADEHPDDSFFAPCIGDESENHWRFWRDDDKAADEFDLARRRSS
jgi:hypothetical protein